MLAHTHTHACTHTHTLDTLHTRTYACTHTWMNRHSAEFTYMHSSIYTHTCIRITRTNWEAPSPRWYICYPLYSVIPHDWCLLFSCTLQKWCVYHGHMGVHLRVGMIICNIIFLMHAYNRILYYIIFVLYNIVTNVNILITVYHNSLLIHE